MDSDVMIREATDADIEAMVRLLRVLFTIEADFHVNEAAQRRGLAMMLEDSDHRRVLVAEVEGSISGMCTGQALISTAEGGMAVLVEDLVVLEAYRGYGIGSRLLAAMEAWGFGIGARRLELLADRENRPALDFYQRKNWRQTRLVCLHKKEA
ncbi:MAG TPA: GNAT family N-acetyltransferase [Bacillota bacterium]